MENRQPDLQGAGARPLSLVVAAIVWVAIDILLIRIASGGTLRDWDYVFRSSPLVFVAVMTVGAINLFIAGAMLSRPTDGMLLATAVWGLLVAFVGVALMSAGHDSGAFIVVGALIAGGLAYRDRTRVPN